MPMGGVGMRMPPTSGTTSAESSPACGPCAEERRLRPRQLIRNVAMNIVVGYHFGMKTPQGFGQNERYRIGSVTLRTRHKRGNVVRAYVKIGHPSIWELRANYVWRQVHGPIPKGMFLHHRNSDPLDDSLENLELVDRAGHLNRHRKDFREKAIAAFIRTRRRLRWSTKGPKTGSPGHSTDCRCGSHV